ncbi:MAG: hypothetical protein AB1782_09005 [Cyanobacteriota bacterium]
MLEYTYKSLLIFVEGPDDTRFFESIICPLLTTVFDDVVSRL